MLNTPLFPSLNAHTHTHKYTHTHMHTHTHAHMHTHIHTHTHTHTAGEHTPLPPTLDSTDGQGFSSAYHSRGHTRTVSEVSFASSAGSLSSQATPASRGQQGSAISETTTPFCLLCMKLLRHCIVDVSHMYIYLTLPGNFTQ